MRWSVSLQAEGDRVIELDEVVELADAVATSEGIASGMGTYGYGVQVVVEAETADAAVELAMDGARERRGEGAVSRPGRWSPWRPSPRTRRCSTTSVEE